MHSFSTLFGELIDSAGLMALIVMAYSTVLRFTPRIAEKSVVVGLLFGIAGILSMLDPIRTSEGFHIDARNVMATLAAPFGGGVAAIITGVMLGSYRLYLGGAGAMIGISTITMASVVGYIFYRVWRGKIPDFRGLVFLALANCSIVVVLPLIPIDVNVSTFSAVLFAYSGSVIIGTVIVGAFLAREERLVTLQERLRGEATTDALTALANRRTFDQMAERLSENAARRKTTYCMLLIDIDRFKSINDRYGHQFGDRVLAEVARVVKLQTRENDVVARYGGEEIAVLMPSVSIATGARVAERVRENIAQSALDMNGEEVAVTVSIGVSGPSGEVNLPFHRVFKAADDALYRAKDAGRNRVEIAAIA